MGLFNTLMHTLAGDMQELPLRLAPDGRLVARAFRARSREEIDTPPVELDALRARLAALDHVQALAEFSPEGEVLDANTNFLNALGFPLDELQGLHHCHLVAPEYSHNPEYSEMWAKLKRGHSHAHVCAFKTADGGVFSASVSYAPVFDGTHRVRQVLAVVTHLPVLGRGRMTTAHRLTLPRSLGLSV